MKRNFFYAGAYICAMAALSSCTNDELSSRFEKDGMVEVTAGMDAGSRTAVEDKLNGKGEYDIVWSTGDEIYLFGGKSYATMTLISGAGNSEAQFDGRIYGYASQLKNAIYPVPTVNGDGTYGLELGSEYGYSKQSNAPMFGSLSDNYVSFGLLTAMARINVDVEEGDEIELVMKDENGNPAIIAGKATISSTGVLTMDNEGETSVKVTFNETGNCMLDIPVPVGSYKGYTVKLNGVEIANKTLDDALPLGNGQILVAGSAEAPETAVDATEIVIINATQLRWFAEQVNTGNTFAEKTIKLGADIDLKNIPWTPVGNGTEGAVSFRGTFDGQGNTISNIKINEDASAYDGFFGSVWGATIKNLILENVSVESGRLVARVNGDVTNSTTTVKDVLVNSSSTDKLFDKVEDGAIIIVDGYQLVKTTEELADALGNNITKVYLAEGEFKLPDVKNKDVLLRGENLNAIVDYSHMGGYQEVSGSSFKFENMTVKCAEKGYPYPGLQHTTSVSYEKCHILGTVNLFSPATFKFCTFDSKSAEHNVVTYGSDEVTFENCEFTYADRSVNCYAENASERDVKVAFTECEFTKVTGKETTGAIETNSSLMKSLTLTINNCSVNEGDLWWISSWDSMNGAKTYVTVNGMKTVTTAEQLRGLAEKATGNVEITLTKDIVMGYDDKPSDAIQFKNATGLTIYGNNKTLTLKGKAKHQDGVIESYNCILADAGITVKDLTIVNEKLGKDGSNTNADRSAVYTFVRGTEVIYNNVIFKGGVVVETNETFIGCDFTESILMTDENGYAKDGKFCMFINHQYNDNKTKKYVVNLEGCTFNASGYGCVKVAGNKGANITVNVKGCTFFNTCPSNSWSTETPKYDIKMTGDNITVNDLGGNTWSSGRNAGFGKG